MAGMDDKPRKPVQFGLQSLFLATAAVVVWALFYRAVAPGSREPWTTFVISLGVIPMLYMARQITPTLYAQAVVLIWPPKHAQKITPQSDSTRQVIDGQIGRFVILCYVLLGGWLVYRLILWVIQP